MFDSKPVTRLDEDDVATQKDCPPADCVKPDLHGAQAEAPLD